MNKTNGFARAAAAVLAAAMLCTAAGCSKKPSYDGENVYDVTIEKTEEFIPSTIVAAWEPLGTADVHAMTDNIAKAKYVGCEYYTLEYTSVTQGADALTHTKNINYFIIYIFEPDTKSCLLTGERLSLDGGKLRVAVKNYPRNTEMGYPEFTVGEDYLLLMMPFDSGSEMINDTVPAEYLSAAQQFMMPVTDGNVALARLVAGEEFTSGYTGTAEVAVWGGSETRTVAPLDDYVENFKATHLEYLKQASDAELAAEKSAAAAAAESNAG